MITIKNIEEMKKYYNKKTNTYVFRDNVEFDVLDVCVCGSIDAWDINAYNITARNINALNITALNITASDINAWDIKAWNINAKDINAWDIEAYDINAKNITARNISYYAVCYAYNDITCKKIQGRRENAKHFVLDGEITIICEETPR